MSSRPSAPPPEPRPDGRVRVWVDLTNSPHAVVLGPLVERMRARGWDVEITARDYAQTVELLELRGMEHTVIGSHGGGSLWGKARAAADRVAAMTGFGRRHRFDVALAHGSTDLPMACAALRVPNTTMFDYEFATLQHSLNCRLATRVLVPAAIPPARLRRFGARPPKLVRYPGLKEDYALFSFRADPAAAAALGIDGSRIGVVLRPPADVALYHRFQNPLFDDVLAELGRRDDVRAVVLPRTPEQGARIRARALPSIVVPDGAVDGASLIAAADLVVSAGGTMNREAVALGTPVYTALAARLGGVDAALVRDGSLRPLRRVSDLVVARKPAQGLGRPRRDPDVLVELALSGLARR
jgi:predicted glycosyltransferase